jgi:hypothetical protein
MVQRRLCLRQDNKRGEAREYCGDVQRPGYATIHSDTVINGHDLD